MFFGLSLTRISTTFILRVWVPKILSNIEQLLHLLERLSDESGNRKDLEILHTDSPVLYGSLHQDEKRMIEATDCFNKNPKNAPVEHSNSLGAHEG